MADFEGIWTDSNFEAESLGIWDDFDQTAINFDIFTASSLGNWDCIEYYIEKNENIVNLKNHAGWTALMYACTYGHDNVVQSLLKAKSIVHVRNKAGQNALMLAAMFGNNNIIETLLNEDVILEERDHADWTALYHAVHSGQETALHTLLKRKANPNACDRRTGKTPLMCAAEMGNGSICLALLEAGAIVNMRNKMGHDTLFYAERSQTRSVVVLIQTWARKVNGTTLRASLECLSGVDGKVQNYSKMLTSKNGNLVENRKVFPSDLKTLLQQLELSSLLPLLEEQAVDLELFLSLTDQDLKEIGIMKLGPRRKITSAISRWHNNAPIENSLQQAYGNKLAKEKSELETQNASLMEELEQLKKKINDESTLRFRSETHTIEAKRRLNECYLLAESAQRHVNFLQQSISSPIISPVLYSLEKSLEKLSYNTNPSIPRTSSLVPNHSSSFKNN